MSLILSAAQSKAVDVAAMQTLGIPGVVLMENAGRGVAEIVRRTWQGAASFDVRVVCGAGQNGGDGYVVARHLASAGARVTVLSTAPAGKLAGDAAVFAQVAAQLGLPVRDLSNVSDVDGWRAALAGADVIVDAIFGTGLRADVTGTPAAAIEAMNGASALRVSIDLPSGLDADTGRARGIAVAPHVTATMGALKLGLAVDGEAQVGRVEIVDLGVAFSTEVLVEAARSVGPLCHWIETAEIAQLVPRRAATAHKGSSGHVLIVAGSPGKTGAAVLVGRSALRGGAGLVTIATTIEGQAALDAKVLELMTTAYAPGPDANSDSMTRIVELAKAMKAVAIGPGIPLGPSMRGLVHQLAADLNLPVVVDADGLTLLAADGARVLRSARKPRILTPHPGEMARLTGLDVAEVQRDRLSCARRLATAANAVVVLKGARTIVASPDGTAHVNPAADPALATAGSGDVLTGLITALCAQGLSAVDAARVGVHLHGLAAEDATRTLGTQNLIAGDLPEAIARVMERLRHDSRVSSGHDRQR